MRLSLLISVLSHIPVYVTTWYGLMLYKTLPRELKIFSWFLFVTGLIQLLSLVLALQQLNNMPLLHLYVASSFSLLCWFYAKVLNSFIDQKIVLITGLLFLVFTIINSVFFQNIFTFNSHALTIESILVIILSLSTYMLFLNNAMTESKKGLSTSLNWINSGLFIYYASNLLIYYFGSILTRFFSQSINMYTWVLHSVFSVVMYFCFFTGLWKRPKS